MMRAALVVTTNEATAMCSEPSTITATNPDITKKKAIPVCVPIFQPTTIINVSAVATRVSGATKSPNRCSKGTRAKIRAVAALIPATGHSRVVINSIAAKLAQTAAAIPVVMLRTCRRRVTLSA
ncbi:Uncharacterised protein [Mycobacterium tuberculosis]|nr:Uncharacterised protein [Mycobacterium tuberculosis]